MFAHKGAGKKKRLTDPVKIIPFPNQSLRDKVSKAVAKPVLREMSKNPMIKPPPRVLETPSGHTNSSSISIKKLLEKKEEMADNVGNSLNLPRELYTYDDLKMSWRKFAFTMKTDGKETFYNALIRREPKLLAENEYLLEVDNQVQVDYIQAQFTDMHDFIRKDLRNYDISFKLEVTSNPEQEIKFQTGKDKFAALARKNPNLHTLKNTFNLDIEY
ncbi:MAG: hypothetical protein A3D92_01190 [Bacteroidetes bacterium RIFCSPHIGHO2_02_FULL_44_7]|nr:MAG: hypothetical protein A3D92_01190 [Bacteroidetes bacterium RIFCSPHIGHO2_02_FULL_44_7]